MAKTDVPALDIGSAPLADLVKIPVQGDELPRVKRARDAADKDAADRASADHRNRTIAAPPSPAIPADVQRQAELPRLEAVTEILTRSQRCADEITATSTALATARQAAERNRTARAERQAAAIVAGQTVPADDTARRDAEAIASLEARLDALHAARRQLDHRARELLADELKGAFWPAQRRLRRDGLRAMLDGLRAVQAAQQHLAAAERAGLAEVGRVRCAVPLDLGPAHRITPGKEIERTDPYDQWGRAMVLVGREPDQVERLDDVATAAVRAFLDGALGVPALVGERWFNQPGPAAVQETIVNVERALDGLQED